MTPVKAIRVGVEIIKNQFDFMYYGMLMHVLGHVLSKYILESL